MLGTAGCSHMTDKKKQTEAGATELSEEDLNEVQGGSDLEISVKDTKEAGPQTIRGGFKSISGMDHTDEID